MTHWTCMRGPRRTPERWPFDMSKTWSSMLAAWPSATARSYGPGAIDDQVELVREASVPARWGWRRLQLVGDLDDAAGATVLAVEQNASGVFNIVDDEPAPANEWLPYLASCAGAKRPMRVPKWLARLLAGDVAVAMMTEGRGFSNAKAKRELDWELRYPSWRQGFREALA